jgi:hypothetical protein
MWRDLDGLRLGNLERVLMINDRDIFDIAEPDRDEVEATLNGVYAQAVRLAREIMGTDPAT